MTPPGWYPDPWAPGTQRWWSGREWTGYTAPLLGAPAKSTDGFAIASPITSLVGLTPVGIVLGFVAKRRIRNSDGRVGGGGLATAGIAIGGVFLALSGVIIALAVSGVFDEVNRDDYSGEEAQVADVIDRFEEAYENSDGEQICRKLFTGDLAGAYASQGGCESVWGDDPTGYSEIDIQSLTITGDSATAMADDQNDDEDWTFDLTRQSDGRWLICNLD